MRIAIVSDIHDNLTALDAVLQDLKTTAPDLVLHGGDLVGSGSSPVEVLDEIRDLGWQGVVGNTDEMLFRPDSLEEFAAKSPQLHALFATIREMADWTRERLGEERLAWLRRMPQIQIRGPVGLVHASPETCWHSPSIQSSDDELASVYSILGQPIAVYAHIHTPFLRAMPKLSVVNTGSVSLSYDGDPRAAYLLLDDGRPSIRRVEYDLEKEISALKRSGLPHAEWVGAMLKRGGFVMP